MNSVCPAMAKLPTTLVIDQAQWPNPTAWESEGYAEQPQVHEAGDSLFIFRTFGGTNKEDGWCFFTPAIGCTPVSYWTAELLETELNTALWGNDFDKLQKYRVIPKTRYKIGPIAHDSYTGIDNDSRTVGPHGDKRFIQWSWVTPSRIFKQVTFFKEAGNARSDYVQRVGEPVTILPGRYHRTAVNFRDSKPN